jgi:cell division cycle 20-like protein 1 (cofactor of APC complex)
MPGNDFDASSEATTTIVKNDPGTPQLISPPDTRTPPTAAAKRVADPPRDPRDPSSEPINAAALSKALHKVRRDFTPGLSPSRKRARVQHDRYARIFVMTDLTA